MKQVDKKGHKNHVGARGEIIAANYLKRAGFVVLGVNYAKKWGEIDIVAQETGINGTVVRFIEVKTVSYDTKEALLRAVSQQTWRPEENVHHAKLLRLQRTIESWLAEHRYGGMWQIDVAAVRVVMTEKYATINYIENVIIG